MLGTEGGAAIRVINPSGYCRSDYVELEVTASNLASQGYEAHEKEGALLRLGDESPDPKLPCQIDRPFGEDDPTRVLTFFAANIPPGREDYAPGGPEVHYKLVGGSASTSESDQRKLWCAHYYSEPKSTEPADGHSREWDRKRSAAVDGVKLANGRLEVYFRTRPSPGGTDVSHVGAATTVDVPTICRHVGGESMDFLSGFILPQTYVNKLWGQLVELTFLPPPWVRNAPTVISLRDQQYDVVWSNPGPVRAIISLRSAPFTLEYESTLPGGKGGFRHPLECHVFRVLCVYPNCWLPFYEEQLFVRLIRTRRPLWFRPSYLSRLPPPGVFTDLRWFEHIPDYFAVWRHFGLSRWGFLFGADVHVRSVRFSPEASELSWSLQTTDRVRGIHGFLFHDRLPHGFDPFHVAGHYMWYERLLKPLRAWTGSTRPPVPLSYD